MWTSLTIVHHSFYKRNFNFITEILGYFYSKRHATSNTQNVHDTQNKLLLTACLNYSNFNFFFFLLLYTQPRTDKTNIFCRMLCTKLLAVSSAHRFILNKKTKLKKLNISCSLLFCFLYSSSRQHETRKSKVSELSDNFEVLSRSILIYHVSKRQGEHFTAQFTWRWVVNKYWNSLVCFVFARLIVDRNVLLAHFIFLLNLKYLFVFCSVRERRLGNNPRLDVYSYRRLSTTIMADCRLIQRTRIPKHLYAAWLLMI